MQGLEWRIYYDDGTTFSNLDGRFEDAPSDGILGIVEADPEVGYVLYHGKDYYYLLADGSIGMADDPGPYLRTLGVIKFGRWTGRGTWGEVFETMVDEAKRDFPNKGGHLAREGKDV